RRRIVRVDEERADEGVVQSLREGRPGRAAVGALEEASSQSPGQQFFRTPRNDDDRRDRIRGEPVRLKLPGLPPVDALLDAVERGRVDGSRSGGVESQLVDQGEREPVVEGRPALRGVLALVDASAESPRKDSARARLEGESFDVAA